MFYIPGGAGFLPSTVGISTHTPPEKDQAFFPEDLLATSRLNSCVFFLGFLEGVAGLKFSKDPPDGWLQLFLKIPYRLEWQSMVNEVMLSVSSW